jgi:hypothetical protein
MPQEPEPFIDKERGREVYTHGRVILLPLGVEVDLIVEAQEEELYRSVRCLCVTRDRSNIEVVDRSSVCISGELVEILGEHLEDLHR